jgi:hypothetical protein
MDTTRRKSSHWHGIVELKRITDVMSSSKVVGKSRHNMLFSSWDVVVLVLVAKCRRQQNGLNEGRGIWETTRDPRRFLKRNTLEAQNQMTR